MKKIVFISIACITNLFYAQTTINFETLTVPESGFYNGSTDYTGSGESQHITYSEDIANFYVDYTNTGTFDFWSGFAYSNQTDLVTASFTNYSAYSSAGGGANGSSNYGFVFTFGDTMTFNETVNISSIMVANGVWTYHYMNGTDGSGTGTYVAGDFLKLIITAVFDDGTLGETVEFNLADFTNGNAYIIEDWTIIDLSSLGNVSGLKFQLETLDDFTPFYFGLDDIVFTETLGNQDVLLENNISIYPNPTKNRINITNVLNANISISDLNGKVIFRKENCLETEKINFNNSNQGIYFIKIEGENTSILRKLIIK